MSQRNPPSLDVSTRVKPSLRGSAPLHGLLSLRVCVLFDRGSNSSSRNFAHKQQQQQQQFIAGGGVGCPPLEHPPSSPPPPAAEQCVRTRFVRQRGKSTHTHRRRCVYVGCSPGGRTAPLLLCVYQSPSRSRGVTTKPPVRAEKANKRPIVSSVCVLIVGDSLPKKVSIAPAKEERGLPKHLRHDLWRRVNYSCKLPLI